MRARSLAAFLLSAFLALTAYTPATVAGQTKDVPKLDPKDMGSDKKGEPKWPTVVAGKALHEWLKDATESTDPQVRESALKTLPLFGPEAKKVCSKKLLGRMTAERDPGVRITVFNTAAVVGLEDADIKQAVHVLARIVDEGAPGGISRLHAVQTLAIIGPKAEEGSIKALTGVACGDPSYETRRSIASALGSVGFDETHGPNQNALNKLAGALAKDDCAAVRMEALQSLVLLGPPWAGPVKGKGAAPVINFKAAEFVADRMRARIGTAKMKEPVEPDKQLEIWCRIVLMRFDPKEQANPAHLNAIARHVDSQELGPQLQALQALRMLGEQAGSKVDVVTKVLRADDDSFKTMGDVDSVVLASALNALAAMGVEARGAIPQLEKLEKKLAKIREDRVKSDDFRKQTVDLKPDQLKMLIGVLPEEIARKSVVDCIDFINKSKPGMPGGATPGAPPAPEKK
jgi:HEAT repeat protein